MNERRKKGCQTPNCNGILFSDGALIHCTNCEFIVEAKRREDKKEFRKVADEFNS